MTSSNDSGLPNIAALRPSKDSNLVMKKSCLAATMVNIPNDVLRNNIFIRLPAKQIAGMRSLSKTWNHVLSDPSFIKSHLHHSIHNQITRDLFVFYDSDFYNNIYFTIDASQYPFREQLNHMKIPPSGPNYVLGSVNGLICFWRYTVPKPSTDDECFLNLWNPSLSALIVLPNSNIPFVSDGRLNQYVFRFGYDPKTDDYKVVMFNKEDGIEWRPVKVYSVKKGYWESISEKFPSHITGIYYVNEVSGDGHDGHLHMLCYLDAGMIKQTIISFDLSDENFSEISLPDPIQRNYISQTNVLGVLFQNICVMSCMSQGECQVWVMEEYGVTTSWVKRHVFTQSLSGFNIALGFSLRGELIFESGDRRLALYDPNGDLLKVLKPIDKEVVYLKIVQYVESLVWVGNSCGSTQTV